MHVQFGEKKRVGASSPFPTDEGWLYLAAVKDLYTKGIVKYAMNERMTYDLVDRALFWAVAATEA
ncbi:MAG: hypothetical protein GJV46_13635 [Geobacter sp.]|nr:hypothetical protein [Geobacter sp.]